MVDLVSKFADERREVDQQDITETGFGAGCSRDRCDLVVNGLVINNHRIPGASQGPAKQLMAVVVGNHAFTAVNSIATDEMDKGVGLTVLVKTVRRGNARMIGRRDHADQMHTY